MGIVRARHKRTEVKDSRRPEPFPLQHVAIIMDGNRRWADKKRLPRLFGHREGVKTLKDLVKYVGGNGLRYLTVYAFSSENWNRSAEEVTYLMQLLAEAIKNELEELHTNKVRLRFLGDLSGMPVKLRQEFDRAMERTKDNTGLNLQVCINYGSRLELTEAVKKIAAAVAAGQLAIDDVDADLVGSHLYTKELPDPDLLIRTGGEMRLSNYLLWQAAYTELYITPVLWPEFSPEHFEAALEEFSSRQRRFGGD
jgi:undecaprenyl diphosphate synthase